MGVRRVDQDVIERDARLALDPPRGAVEDVAIDHQHVALDEGDLPPLRVLDHDRRGAQLPLLAGDLVRADPAADDHRIVRDQVDRRRPRLELAGGCAADRRPGRAGTSPDIRSFIALTPQVLPARGHSRRLPLVRSGRSASRCRIVASRRGIATSRVDRHRPDPAIASPGGPARPGVSWQASGSGPSALERAWPPGAQNLRRHWPGEPGGRDPGARPSRPLRLDAPSWDPSCPSAIARSGGGGAACGRGGDPSGCRTGDLPRRSPAKDPDQEKRAIEARGDTHG